VRPLIGLKWVNWLAHWPQAPDPGEPASGKEQHHDSVVHGRHQDDQ